MGQRKGLRKCPIISKEKNVRDNRFVAKDRGGLLSAESHRLLIKWAINCVEHAIEIAHLADLDKRAIHAISIAKEWEKGNATVTTSRRAAISAHDAARECLNMAKQAIIRACGHTAATAHMADHSLRAREYLLKGLRNILNGDDFVKEKRWQFEIAESKIQDLIE